MNLTILPYLHLPDTLPNAGTKKADKETTFTTSCKIISCLTSLRKFRITEKDI